MKTNQIMLRELPLEAAQVYNKTTVRQRTKDGFFNANDILEAYNKSSKTSKRIDKFIKSDSTKAFDNVIIKKENIIPPHGGNLNSNYHVNYQNKKQTKP